MVRQWQQLFHGKRYSSTEMVNPNFQLIAEGYGIPCQKVVERDDLSAAIDKMLSTDGPYFLEVVVEQEENVFPMVPSGDSVSNIRLE
jgi:acetolactate synthase-1/2/3 large subunit